MKLSRRIFSICAALYLFSQILFLVNIQFPRGPNFDEFHYVPSAKQFLALKENQNWEHPPLGKLIMAAGIAVGGDRPIGWRLMSTIFGSLTLVGMYLWALAVFRDEKTALWVALITLTNQLLYVQARIGMLDTFMFAFMVWGIAAFCQTWNPDQSTAQNRRLLYFLGVMFGLATACKWFAVIPWVLCIGLVVLVRLLQVWKTRFENPQASDWYQPKLWDGIRLRDWALSFGVIPLFFYFMTFVPYLFVQSATPVTVLDFLGMQKKMWDGQGRVVTAHPYMSSFSGWPLMVRPIWYAFDKEPLNSNLVRGVMLIGNPLILWGGLVALLACAWGFIRERRRDAFLILVLYLALYGAWAVIPRKINFFYYYYPAGMTLSLALGYCIHWISRNTKMSEDTKNYIRWASLTAALCVFIYFFPILAALKIPADSFRKWMWFTSWI